MTPLPSYREIPLTQGQVALVDEADYIAVSAHKWFAWWNRSTSSFYAARSLRVSGKNTRIYMHRQILGLEAGNKLQGDHVNGDTLDNRRTDNLRTATHEQNQRNKRLTVQNTSGFKGVSKEIKTGRWKAYIRQDGRYRHLGYGDTPEAAHRLYVKAAQAIHGDFACTE